MKLQVTQRFGLNRGSDVEYFEVGMHEFSDFESAGWADPAPVVLTSAQKMVKACTVPFDPAADEAASQALRERDAILAHAVSLQEQNDSLAALLEAERGKSDDLAKALADARAATEQANSDAARALADAKNGKAK